MNRDNKPIHNRVSAAKEIRQILKKTWPAVKFSVTSQSFAGGCSIDIRWNLGPVTEKVERITKRYQYGSFDGMNDIYNYDQTLVAREDGSVAELGGAKYVMCQRDYLTQEEIENSKLDWRSPLRRDLFKEDKTFYQTVARDLCKAAGIEYQGLEMPIDDNVIFSRHISFGTKNLLRDIVHQILSKTDFPEGYHGIKHQIGEGGVEIKNGFIAY